MSSILRSQAEGDVLAHVSGNLRRLRHAAGLSQTALAEASGISRRMIVAVEAGSANISLSSLDKLAAAMSVGFVDMVRDPERGTRSGLNQVADVDQVADVNQMTWRGRSEESTAVLLCSAPAAAEAQMWLWALGPGERYEAEPDPAGWHEMIFVIEGSLEIVLPDGTRTCPANAYAVYSSSQPYAYVNPGTERVRFLRNVVA